MMQATQSKTVKRLIRDALGREKLRRCLIDRKDGSFVVFDDAGKPHKYRFSFDVPKGVDLP